MATSLSPSMSPSILTPTTTTTATSTAAITPPMSNTPPPPSTSEQEQEQEQEQQAHTTTPTLQRTNDMSSASNARPFQFPPHHSFPPFYTLQPNLSTLHRQLVLWSSLITLYCSHTRTFRLSLSPSPTSTSTSTTATATAASTQLFTNPRIHRSLDIISIRRILDFMASSEGDHRAEWINPSSPATATTTATATAAKIQEADKSEAYIWYRHPSEWGRMIASWVDETGQKGTILTVYELRDSDAVVGKEWTGMDQDMLRKCLDALVKKGKAQIFEGQGGDGAGVRFF